MFQFFQVSAQDSRKRKKEYVDAMEDRVRKCTEQNEELNKKIQLLETHNKTLAGQLKRLHQIIVNGGLKNSQTSTAMMVLLLSTALFLMPGLNKDQQANSGNYFKHFKNKFSLLKVKLLFDRVNKDRQANSGNYFRFKQYFKIKFCFWKLLFL